MAFDINLTSGMRSNLVSLQNTTTLMSRTQSRLSTGKAVNAAVDDPSKFFAAADHTNHATDLAARKSDMGEAIQSVQEANQGITSITSLLSQAKGLAQSAQSASQTDRATLAGQFDTLRTQIDQLASDSGYNGKNFLKSDTLTVLFNEKGTSSLTVTGFDGSATGLGVTAAGTGAGKAVDYAAEGMGTDLAISTPYTLSHIGADTNVVVKQTVAISGEALVALSAAVSIGTVATLAATGNITQSNISVYISGGATLALGTDYALNWSGDQASVTFLKAIALATATGVSVSYTMNNIMTGGGTRYSLGAGGGNTAGTVTITGSVATGTITVSYTAQSNSKWGSDDSITTDLNNLENAVSTLRTQASTMAANLSVVTNRQSWSAGTINTLQTGSDNLTLADMNEEGANLLALQTRQQLGIQALSMASQANQSVMRLFG